MGGKFWMVLDAGLAIADLGVAAPGYANTPQDRKDCGRVGGSDPEGPEPRGEGI